ncbi:hypothetical protein BCR32DRAFT_248758 [Anaeromyces robustus]|uniref:Uncharacterized protein n=1 Tax=Anaeromyces robustus TaxID=1754192 RepID=A0A1Y1WS89_9FUNG|nr:hypothetical protein BCR32DRAFT_248758 [Anaeromyces robustus]|eukprot:ORX76399.1 hypothetical protein BCR32DRAFT_248758 [Anaeromyces robustus]
MDINLIYSILGAFGGLLMCFTDLLLDLKGVPLAGLGFDSLGNQVMEMNSILGFIFKFIGHFGSVGGFFVHTTLCYAPCIYKSVEDKKEAEKALEGLLNAAQIPFLIFAFILNIGTSAVVTYALIKNYIHLSKFFILLTPFCTLFFGIILRKIKHDWFYDLPGIIMPSFATGCIGLMGILNILLN